MSTNRFFDISTTALIAFCAGLFAGHYATEYDHREHEEFKKMLEETANKAMQKHMHKLYPKSGIYHETIEPIKIDTTQYVIHNESPE